MGLAVDRFDYAEFVRADLDQRHFTHDTLERILDQVQPWFEHVRLNTDLTSVATLGREASWRQIPSLFDCISRAPTLTRMTAQNDQQYNQQKAATKR